MSFRLKEAVFRIRCREPGCPFNSEFVVKENLMGVTEADIDSEALKIAKNLGFIKHDAMYGRKHQLVNPEIFKVGSSYERIGGLMATEPTSSTNGDQERGRVFRRGEVIIRKAEDAAIACEVLRGSAFNAGHPGLKYKPGSIFGTAALFNQRARPADVLASEDDTAIAFHNVKELTKSNPPRARELYDRALEDIFHILVHLEGYSATLEKKVQQLQAKKGARKQRVPTKPVARAKKARKPTALKAKSLKTKRR